MKIQTLWLVDLLGLLLQNLSDKAFFSIRNSQTRHIFLHDFFWNLQWLTSQQPWSIENLHNISYKIPKYFFITLYTELIKNSVFSKNRPINSFCWVEHAMPDFGQIWKWKIYDNVQRYMKKLETIEIMHLVVLWVFSSGPKQIHKNRILKSKPTTGKISKIKIL